MGGIVGLTVRFDEERTYRGSCWTNVLPEGLFAVPFYLGVDESRRHVDGWLKMILDNRKAHREIGELWGHHDMLAPVEYGLVVVDYLTDTLISAQGYNNPTRVTRYPDDAEKYDVLDRAGLLTLLPPSANFVKASIKVPFASVAVGFKDDADAQLQEWCEANFGLSAAERRAWGAWIERRAEREEEG